MAHTGKENTTKEASRRRFLRTTGALTSAAIVAGCLGDGDDGDNGEDGNSGNGGDENNNGNDSDGNDGSNGGDDEDETSTTEESVQPRTFRTLSGTLRTLDPIKTTAYDGKTILNQVFDTLTQYENGEINIKNLLATDFQLKNNGKTLVFSLTEEATFPDGDPVTAHDVVYSWERLAGSPNSRRASYLLSDMGVAHETQTETGEDGEENEVYVPGSMEVEAVDDYTLEVTFQSAFHAPLKYFALVPFAVLPEGLVGDVEGYDGEMDYETFAQESPVGSGPFTLENWTSGTELQLSAREDYHGEGPYITGVHYNIADSAEVQYNYSQNKNSDVVSVPISKYDRNKVSIEGTDDRGRSYGTYGELSNGETASYLEVPQVNVFYIGFNQQRTDRPARRAMSYALNRQTIIDQFLKGVGRQAFHVVPPALFPGGAERYDTHAEDYPYGVGVNIDQAREVMADAGYSSDNRYEMTLTVSEGDPEPSIGKLLQSKLRSAHINLEVNTTPNSTLLSQAAAGKLDCYTTNWTGLPLASNFSKIIYPPFTDVSFWKGEQWGGTDAAQRASQAWEKAQENSAPTDSQAEARGEAYVTMEEANWTDVVLLPMYHQIGRYMHYDWVERPRIGARGEINQKLNTIKVHERS